MDLSPRARRRKPQHLRLATRRARITRGIAVGLAISTAGTGVLTGEAAAATHRTASHVRPALTARLAPAVAKPVPPAAARHLTARAPDVRATLVRRRPVAITRIRRTAAAIQTGPGGLLIVSHSQAGNALPGGTFELYTANGRVVGSPTGVACTTTTTRRMASCLLSGLTVGTYFVVQTVSPGDFLPIRPRLVRIRPGRVALLITSQVEWVRWAAITFIAYGPGRISLSDATFELYTAHQWQGSQPTGIRCTTKYSRRNHVFECTVTRVPPGRYVIEEIHAPAGYAAPKARLRSVRAGGGYRVAYLQRAGG